MTCSDNCDLNIWRADVKEEIGTVSGYSRKYDGLGKGVKSAEIEVFHSMHI